jgi:hypothetical protein
MVFCQRKLVMNTAVVATIREQRKKIAEFVARQGADDIVVDFILTPSGERYREDFEPLLHGTLDLLNNGILYLRPSPDEPLVEVEQVLRKISPRAFKLVYNPTGIEEAYEMVRRIALEQPATEPFSRLVDSLNRRLSELGLPQVRN